MENNMVKALIKELFKNKDNVKYCGTKALFDHSGLSAVKTFHMSEAFVISTNDEDICGIRADHFLVEFGYSEDLLEEYENAILISGNHKGYREYTLIGLNKNGGA